MSDVIDTVSALESCIGTVPGPIDLKSSIISTKERYDGSLPRR